MALRLPSVTKATRGPDMSYTAGSQGTDANCGIDFLNTLSAAILAVTGWSLIETWTSGAKTAKVWKSAVANNGVADFYVIGYIASNVTVAVSLKCGEAYDSVNHKLQKYVPASGSGITVDASDNT